MGQFIQQITAYRHHRYTQEHADRSGHIAAHRDTEDDPEIMDKMMDELISRKIGVPVETIQRLKRIIKKGELKTLDAFMLYIDGDNMSIINN